MNLWSTREARASQKETRDERDEHSWRICVLDRARTPLREGVAVGVLHQPDRGRWDGGSPCHERRTRLWRDSGKGGIAGFALEWSRVRVRQSLKCMASTMRSPRDLVWPETQAHPRHRVTHDPPRTLLKSFKDHPLIRFKLPRGSCGERVAEGASRPRPVASASAEPSAPSCLAAASSTLSS